MATFTLEAIFLAQKAILEGSLDATINRLIENVSIKVLGFAKLLMAGIIMSDKPSFVRYGYSVPLDQFEKFGRNGKMKRVARPLAGWRKKVKAFYREARKEYREESYLVYFYLLNCKGSYFTLLKINGQEEKIYYYNLIVNGDVINSILEST
ncbi:hypothetical protein V2W45_1328155 [Cenococcum geophilum]